MANRTHSFGHGLGTGNSTLLENPELCTLQTCDLSLADFNYLPTLPGNALFAAIFGLYFIAQLGLGIRYKTWGYMSAMLLGLLLEVIGYVARVLIHDNPFNGDYFLMYLVTLTIAPALLTASIYLCLGRIVHVYGEHISYFKPRTYTVVFCTFDLICLVLQAVGGAIASMADTTKESDLGKNIMLAGLIFQVVALALFALCAGEFALRVFKGKDRWNPRYHNIVHSLLFKSFLVGLLTATITIFIRCIYRCVELSGGFNSDLFIGHEAIYMVFEGTMIIIACTCLTVLHPGVCFQGAWRDADFTFRTKKGGSEKLRTSSSDEENVESRASQIELTTQGTRY